MENFVVSARKYRPARFEEVVGQANVTTTLKNAIKSGHLAHSFLFCGPRGVGKTTCARILAKVINCQKPTTDFEPCNKCESCNSFNKNASFNIFEIDAASNSHVEDIRNLIEQVRYSPQAGKYKIYIIDEVHMLSQNAFNAFLKTLEEPPSYAIFILATTEKHKIIPTILSRCQIFDFNRIKTEDIGIHLKKICVAEKIEADSDALHIIAQKADGALRDALSMYDRLVSFSAGKLSFKNVIDNLNILDYDYYFKITDCLLAEDPGGTLTLFNEILQKGFEGDDFILGLSEHFRNLLVCKDAATVSLLETSDLLKEKYKLQASLSPVSFLLTALNVANDCDVSYKASKNKRLQVEMALIKMVYINSAVKLAKEYPTDNSLKKKILNTKNENSGQVGLVQEKKEDYPPIDVHGNTKVNESVTPSIQPPSSGTKILSFEKLKKVIAEEEDLQKITHTAVDYSNINIEENALMEVWDKYCSTLQSNNKMGLHSFCLNMRPQLLNNYTVEIIIENSMQRDLLDKEKDPLYSFIKKELGLPAFELIFRVEKKEPANGQNTRAYTTSDKFNKMVEKNPLLMEMKKRLDLELEI